MVIQDPKVHQEIEGLRAHLVPLEFVLVMEGVYLHHLFVLLEEKEQRE